MSAHRRASWRELAHTAWSSLAGRFHSHVPRCSSHRTAGVCVCPVRRHGDRWRGNARSRADAARPVPEVANCTVNVPTELTEAAAVGKQARHSHVVATNDVETQHFNLNAGVGRKHALVTLVKHEVDRLVHSFQRALRRYTQSPPDAASCGLGEGRGPAGGQAKRWVCSARGSACQA